jgi:hypothetical protein
VEMPHLRLPRGISSSITCNPFRSVSIQLSRPSPRIVCASALLITVPNGVA